MHRSIEMGNVALPLGVAGNDPYQGGDLIVQPVDRPPIPVAGEERIDAPEPLGLVDVRRLARRDYGWNPMQHFSYWLGARGAITQLLQEAFPNDRQFVERACSGSLRARSMLYLMVHNHELTPEQILDWLASRTLPGQLNNNGDDLIFGAPLDSYWLHQAQTDVQVVDELARIGALRQEEPSVCELLQVFEQTEGTIEEKLAALEALARERNMSELAMAEAFYLLAASCHFGQFLQASGVNCASILTMLRYSDRYRIPPEAAPEVRAGIERELEERATVLWQNMSGLTSDDALVVAKRMVERRWNNQPLIRERLASRFCALLNLIRTDDRAGGLAASWMSTILQHLQLTAKHISLPRDKQLAQVLVNCLFQYSFGEYGPEGSDIHSCVAKMVQVYMRDWHVYPDALISEERVLRMIRDRIFLLEPDTIKDWIQRQPDSLFAQTIATHYCSPREAVEVINQSRKKPRDGYEPQNERVAELLYQPIVQHRSRPGTRGIGVFWDHELRKHETRLLGNELIPAEIRVNIGSQRQYPSLERMAANDRMSMAEKLPLMRRFLSRPSYDDTLPRWLTSLVLPKDWTMPGEIEAAKELVELMVGYRNFAVRGRAAAILANMLSDSHLPADVVVWGEAIFARLAADTKVTVRRDFALGCLSLVSQENVPVPVRVWAMGVLRTLTADASADVRVATVAVLASVLSNHHLPLVEHQAAKDLVNAVIARRDAALAEIAASLLGPIMRNEQVDRSIRQWARAHIDALTPDPLAVHEARDRQQSVTDCYGPMLVNAGLDMDGRMWALRRLRSLAGDADPNVRRETIGWFGTLANGANYLPPDRLLARDHFRFLMGDNNTQVMLRLVAELGRAVGNVVDIHPEDRALFMPMLQELMRHPDAAIRVAVAEELGRAVQNAGLTAPELQAAREGILALAGDADAKVRLKVAEILGRAANNIGVLPEDRVWTRPALDHLSQDPNNDICGRVMQDLLRIAGNVVHDRENNIPPEERAWAAVVVNAINEELPGREVVLAKMAPLWLAMVNNDELSLPERRWALANLERKSSDIRLVARIAAIRVLGEVATNSLLRPELAAHALAKRCLDGAMMAPVAKIQREVAIGYGLIAANGLLPEAERRPVIAIIERLANDAAHPDQRILGVLALSKVASGRAAPKADREWAQRHLARLSQDKDPEVRTAVATALAPVATTMIGAGTPDNDNVGERTNARTWLSRLTRDKSYKVRLATVDAFGQMAWTMFDPEERILPIAERVAAMENLYQLEINNTGSNHERWCVRCEASSRRHKILSLAPHAYEE